MASEDGSWFEFIVRDTGGEGVEIPRLAQLLEDISAAFYAIARARIGAAGPRPGRRTVAEETIAGVRLLRVSPGSARIELAPPAAAAQLHLPVVDEPTAEDVALEFYEEVRDIAAGNAAPAGRWDVRRRVRAVIDDAAEIGARAELHYRPRVPRPGLPPGSVLRASVSTKELPPEPPLTRATRHRVLSGHAYMVDVEPGRQRLRVKLPDGRDLTFEVDESLLPRIPGALDRVVEIEVEEHAEGDVPTARAVRNFEILPSSGIGSDKPPKSVEELEREQRMPPETPDYAALASSIWETEDDVAEFEAYLGQIRRPATA